MKEFEGNFERPLSPAEANARSKRNLALAIILVAFMGLVFAITLVRIKEGVERDQDWVAETAGWQREGAVVEAGEGPPPGVIVEETVEAVEQVDIVEEVEVTGDE